MKILVKKRKPIMIEVPAGTFAEPEMKGAVGVPVNILESAEMDLRVAERTRELRQQVRARKRIEKDLRVAKEEAEFANSAKTEFLANMSHEFRTPLNCILGFSEILKEEMFGPLGNPKYREYVNDINSTCNHLLGLISDILDISKIEAGNLDLDEEKVDLSVMMRACQKIVSVQASKAQVQLSGEIPVDFPLLFADQLHLKQILINLLSNSIKFTPETGTITTRCSLNEDNGIVLTVVDTGSGIAVKDISKVLERFGQARESHTKTHDGLGLGLSIAESLIKLHEGNLEINSAPGKGTTVTLSFPPERTCLDNDKITS